MDKGADGEPLGDEDNANRRMGEIMQYLIGAIAGGLIIGIWAFDRCRHCRDLVELKRSEIKTGLNCLNRLEAAVNRIGNINEARLKVESGAAGVNEAFGVKVLSRKPQGAEIVETLDRIATALEAQGSPVYHVEAEFDSQYTGSKRECSNCRYSDKDVDSTPCCDCIQYNRWKPREDDK